MAIAATHDTNTPMVGIAAANSTSSTSLTAENTVLPTGTHSALRSPVSTPSWSVSSDQATTARDEAEPGVERLVQEAVRRPPQVEREQEDARRAAPRSPNCPRTCGRSAARWRGPRPG